MAADLHPATTGKPADEVEWGYVGVYKDVLIGGLGFAEYRDRYDLSFDEDKKLTKAKAGFGAKSLRSGGEFGAGRV